MSDIRDGPDDEHELLELVDEQGRAVGTAARGECHSAPALMHRAVHVLVFDSEGRLFLQKRAVTKSTAPGRWDSSVGGHAAPGERPERAAARETLEELGVRVEPGELAHAFDHIWPGAGQTEYVHTFTLEHDGPFTLNRDEIDDGRFWTAGEIEASLGTGVFTHSFELEYSIFKERRSG